MEEDEGKKTEKSSEKRGRSVSDHLYLPHIFLEAMSEWE